MSPSRFIYKTASKHYTTSDFIKKAAVSFVPQNLPTYFAHDFYEYTGLHLIQFRQRCGDLLLEIGNSPMKKYILKYCS